MLISQRLEKLAREHDDSRRTVSHYLLDHPEAMKHGTMADIAEATFTSKATLVRLAKQAGFSGWTDFSRAYLVELESRRVSAPPVDPNYPFAPGAPARDIMDAVASVRIEGERRTCDLNDPRDLERAARLLHEARTVCLAGSSVSGTVLELFERKLLDVGKPTVTLSPGNVSRFLRILQPGDCIVALSYSGENAVRIPHRYLPGARERGVRVIGVTGEGDSFLRRNSDVTVTVASDDRLYDKIGPFSSQAGSECALDMLYACFFALDYERNARYRLDLVTESDGELLPYRGEKPFDESAYDTRQ